MKIFEEPRTIILITLLANWNIENQSSVWRFRDTHHLNFWNIIIALEIEIETLMMQASWKSILKIRSY